MNERRPHPSALIRSLARVMDSDPIGRKLLVAPSFGEGGELLRALALHRGGWAGFQVEIPHSLAGRLAAPELARRDLRVLDRFAESALVDRVLDEVLADGAWEAIRTVAEGVGFREAVGSAITALRMAETSPGQLRERLEGSDRGRLLAEVLERFEGRLGADRRVDPAGVVRIATDGLRGGSLTVGERVLLSPGLDVRGVLGAFVGTLVDGGAEALETDGVVGIDPPRGRLVNPGPVTGTGGFLFAPERGRGGGRLEIGLFRASSIREELREVLRRALAAGVPWDEVEITTPDPDVYGAALHALSAELDVPVSFGTGLPLGRTRTGRAIAGYLRWIETGFPSDVVRTLFEAGDLGPPDRFDAVRPRAMARRLRELRVGWGRGRYATAVARERERQRVAMERSPFSSDGRTRAHDVHMRELDALEAAFEHLDAVTPWVPDPFVDEARSVSAGALASGILGFLELVPEVEGSEAVALTDVRERLERMARSLERPTSFEGALATVRRHLDLRVRAAWDEGSPPWKSTGGHVHLTDLSQGGITGRRALFAVGLDAGRFPGAGHQDPILLDTERRAIGPDLETSVDRLHARRWDLAVLAARARGRLTFSYTAWETREARVVQPTPALLDAYRLMSGEPGASFQQMERSLGPPCSPIPRGPSDLDAQDVWLRALAGDGVPLRARSTLRTVFPRLGRGLDADEEAARAEAGPHRGVVRPRPDALDPRVNRDLVMSAARLRTLGECAQRYLYRYVLRVYPPEESTRDPDRWLDPLSRGTALHSVYEALMRDFPDGTQADAEEELFEAGLAILDRVLEETRRERPVPSEAVFRAERGSLRRDLRSFAKVVSEDGAPWVALEYAFGYDGMEPIEFPLEDGSIRIHGKVDRVDRVEDGLRIVDYKTGRRFGFDPEAGVFHGGRRLQHVLYTQAVEHRMDEPVARFEYHFSTERGLNQTAVFERGELEGGAAVLEPLLDMIAQGRFLPTDDPSDCRLCDYGPICRVKIHDRDVESPPAEWGRNQRVLLPEYAELRAVRGVEEGA